MTNQADYSRRHYEKNKEALLKQRKARRVEMRLYIQSRKEVPCTDCEVEYPYYVMDFDHVRGAKDANPSDMPKLGWGLERINAELNKCDVVCANCHRIRTNG